MREEKRPGPFSDDDEYQQGNEGPAELGKKSMYCPRWLDDDAKKEWRRLSTLLIQEGLLTEKTYNSFAAYCQEWSRYQKQQVLINEKGVFMMSKRGEVREAPFVAIAYKALRAMHKSAEEIGLVRGGDIDE